MVPKAKGEMLEVIPPPAGGITAEEPVAVCAFAGLQEQITTATSAAVAQYEEIAFMDFLSLNNEIANLIINQKIPSSLPYLPQN